MRILNSILLPMVVACVCLSIFGCEPQSSPTGIDAAQRQGPASSQGATTTPAPSLKTGSGPQDHPLKGRFQSFESVWVVSHFAEQACNGRLVAGTSVLCTGRLSCLGFTQVTASSAWDWAVPAANTYDPEGPATGSSATVLGTHPYAFCSDTRDATGEVVLVPAKDDQVHGVVTGGEVYELGFDVPGDGQEQFTQVEITGGTGRFSAASGSFVIHSIVRFDGSLARSEILRGGIIRF